MKHEFYKIGSSEIPEWLKNRLMPYQKMNGSIGCVFIGTRRDFELNVGDVIMKIGERIEIRKKGKDVENRWCKKVSGTA